MILLQTNGIDIGGAIFAEENSPCDMRLRHDWPNNQVHLHVQHPHSGVLGDPLALSAEQARKLASTLNRLADAIVIGQPTQPSVEGSTAEDIGRYFHDVANFVDVIRNDTRGSEIVGSYPHSVIGEWNRGKPAVDTASLVASYWRNNGRELEHGSH